MADVLVRDLPAEVVAGLDRRARRLGLSRSEFVRRVLTQEAAQPAGRVTVEDLKRTAEVFADLANPEVMERAWRRDCG